MSDLGPSLIATAESTGGASERPSRRRFWLILIAVIIVFASIMGVVGITWYLKRKAPRDAFALARAGTEAARRNDHVRAAALFAEASAKDPTQSNYLIGAAKSAFMSGRKPEAKLYAQRAWDAGRHTSELLRMLLSDTGDQDHAKALAEAERLLATVSDDVERLTLRADVLAEFGRDDDAESAWRKLIDRRPEPELITRFGHWLVMKERVAPARTLLQEARAANRLDAEGYFDLLNILHVDQLVAPESPDKKPEDLLAIIAEARSRNLLDDRLQFQEAVLTYARLDLPTSIKLLSGLSIPGNDVLANQWRQRARLLLALIFNEMGRPQDIAGLLRIPRSSGPEREGEDLLYTSLSSPDRTLTERMQDLGRVQKLLGDQPLLLLLEARLYFAMGDRKNALSSYAKLPRNLSTSAGPLLEQATLFLAEGNKDAAMGRVLMVHRLYGTTKRSLLLMSKIVGPDGNPKAGQAMQQILLTAGQQDPYLLGAAAEYALSRGDYQTAEQVFSAIAKRDAQDQNAVFGPVRIALARRDWAGALSQCEALPPSYGRDVLQALAYRGAGRFPEALTAFERATREAHPVALDLEMGYTALLAGNIPAAKAARERALASAAGQVAVQEFSATVMLVSGDPAGALDVAKKILGVEPTLSRERLRADALATLGREQEALQAIDGARRTYPEDPGLLILRARLLLRNGRSDDARKELADIDRRFPGQVQVRRLLAEAMLNTGDLEQARTLTDLLLQAAPDVVDHQILRIRVIAQGGNLGVARSAIDSLPAAVPTGQRLLLHAWIDQQEGKPGAAMARLAEKLDEAPVALAWAYGVLSAESATTTEVAPVLQKLSITDSDVLRLCSLAERKGRWRDAAALCGRVLAANPEDPVLNNNWGWYAMQVPGADPAPVLAALEKAYRQMPTNLGVVDSYSEALLWAGKPMVARNLLQAQGDLIARNAQLQHNLGRALVATGDTKGAQAAFRLSLSLAAASNPWPVREARDALAARLTPGALR